MRPYTLSNKVFAPFVRSARAGRPSLARFGSSITSLPYEKFLALWRGSLPADLVYELQFSFNFQLPVVKDPPSLPEGRCLLRKEVIQPLVPQRLPCYDFIPITTHTLGRRMPDFGCRRLS